MGDDGIKIIEVEVIEKWVFDKIRVVCILNLKKVTPYHNAYFYAS